MNGEREPGREPGLSPRHERGGGRGPEVPFALLRWLALVLILALAAPIPGQPEGGPADALAALALAVYFGGAWLLRRRWRAVAPLWLLASEAAAISAAVLLTGGLRSTVFVLYYVTAITAAGRLSWRAHLAFTAAVGVTYVVAAVAPLEFRLGRPEVERLTTRLTLLFIVAIASGVRARQVEVEQEATRHERALVGQLTELAQRNEALLAAERANAARLTRLERFRADFLSTVSHELRTPLTSIKASIGLLLAPETAESDPAQEGAKRRLHENIERNVDRLSALVADLLDAARLQAGQLQLERTAVRLDAVIEHAVATLRPLVRERGQRLEVQLPLDLPPVLGNQRRLEQVLVNLLSNAHKYAPSRSGIVVEVGVRRVRGQGPGARATEAKTTGAGPEVEPAGGEVEVAVVDEGPGVRPQDRDEIFSSFFRSDVPAVRRRQGTGLGLAIARSLVMLHGGQIWVEDGPDGRGSRFVFTLPVAAGPAAPSTEVPDRSRLPAHLAAHPALLSSDLPE